MAAIQASRMSNAEFKRTIHHVDAPHGDTIAQMLQPSYWAHVARLLKEMDIIEVVAEDNSFEASFRVIECTVNWAKVMLRSHTVYQDAQEFSRPQNAAAEYKIEHAGNFHKWRVLRLSDKAVVVSKLNTEDAAREWLKQHLLVLSRAPVKEAAE